MTTTAPRPRQLDARPRRVSPHDQPRLGVRRRRRRPGRDRRHPGVAADRRRLQQEVRRRRGHDPRPARRLRAADAGPALRDDRRGRPAARLRGRPAPPAERPDAGRQPAARRRGRRPAARRGRRRCSAPASPPRSSSASSRRTSRWTRSSRAIVGHWIGTIPWLWLGAGVTGVAVAVAALRHGAAPRWLGCRRRRAGWPHPAARHVAAAVHGRLHRSGPRRWCSASASPSATAQHRTRS